VKKFSILVAVFLVISIVATLLVVGCSPANTSKLKVVTSTSLIAEIVARVGGGRSTRYVLR